MQIIVTFESYDMLDEEHPIPAEYRIKTVDGVNGICDLINEIDEEYWDWLEMSGKVLTSETAKKADLLIHMNCGDYCRFSVEIRNELSALKDWFKKWRPDLLPKDERPLWCDNRKT